MSEFDIGKWVRAARDSRGWTQDQLGDRIGVTKANVSHWETGKHEPSFHQLLRIRDVTAHPLRDVEAAADWPLPAVRRERITSLTPEQLASLQAGIEGMLAAITRAVPTAAIESDRAPRAKMRKLAA